MTEKRRRQVVGHWVAGSNAGKFGTLSDVRAGLVYGRLLDGTSVFGSPQEFQAESGESGENLLAILLPQPTTAYFFAGTIREALAAVYSTALFGRQDTRAWEYPYRYIVDDGEGNAAAVQLAANGLVGGMCSHHPTRNFEFHPEAVPRDQRALLTALLGLPFFQSAVSRVTAVFWSEGGRLSSPEPWFKTYLFGGEIFRRELLDEETWQNEAVQHHDLDPVTAAIIIDISRRAVPLRKVTLTEQEIALVLPDTAGYREEALQQLWAGGMFAESDLRA